MYMPWYETLVRDTAAYRDLKARHLAGEPLLLLEYDGLDRDDPAENCDLDRAALERLLEDDSRPFGHGLVLAGVLLDAPVWRSGCA